MGKKIVKEKKVVVENDEVSKKTEIREDSQGHPYAGDVLLTDLIKDDEDRQLHRIRRALAFREVFTALRGLQDPKVDAILNSHRIEFIDFVKEGGFFPGIGIDYPGKRKIIKL